jgi:hypothetical protein
MSKRRQGGSNLGHVVPRTTQGATTDAIVAMVSYLESETAPLNSIASYFLEMLLTTAA